MANYVSNNTGPEVDRMIDSYLSFRKTIKVFAPEDSIVRVVYNSSTGTENISSFRGNNCLLFFPIKYGEYTVICAAGGTSSQEVIDVDAVQIYEVTFPDVN